MSTEPKDGDIGRAGSHSYLRFSNGKWTYPSGGGTSYKVTPTGERAIPIDVCERLAHDLRGEAYYRASIPSTAALLRKDADILDPPTPEPPRFREGDVVVWGGNPYRYFVNANGVPCNHIGDPTPYPLDSGVWRVVGRFTPKEDA